MILGFAFKSEQLCAYHINVQASNAEESHNMHEFFCLIKGQIEYSVENSRYTMNPGDIILIRAGERHKLKLLSPQPPECFVVHFQQVLLEKIGDTAFWDAVFNKTDVGYGNYYPKNALNDDLVRCCLTSMTSNKNITSNSQGKPAYLFCYLLPILAEIKQLNEIKTSESNLKTINFIGDVCSHITEFLSEPISLKNTAEHFLVSQAYLNRRFKAATGYTIKQYIIHERLKLAHSLIEKGYSSNNAAYNSGWQDYSSFYRQYKNSYGVSPKGK